MCTPLFAHPERTKLNVAPRHWSLEDTVLMNAGGRCGNHDIYCTLGDYGTCRVRKNKKGGPDWSHSQKLFAILLKHEKHSPKTKFLPSLAATAVSALCSQCCLRYVVSLWCLPNTHLSSLTCIDGSRHIFSWPWSTCWFPYILKRHLYLEKLKLKISFKTWTFTWIN